jgi:hypothetical protein
MNESTVAFDAQNFLETNLNAPLDTQRPQLPSGVYEAQIVKVNPPEKINTKKGEAVVFKVGIQVTNPPQDGNDYGPLDYMIFLDINESGGLDTGKGKNVGLGRLRNAVGQNTAKGWNPNDLLGQELNIKVDQRQDNNDPDVYYAQIKSVAPKG